MADIDVDALLEASFNSKKDPSKKAEEDVKEAKSSGKDKDKERSKDKERDRDRDRDRDRRRSRSRDRDRERRRSRSRSRDRHRRRDRTGDMDRDRRDRDKRSKRGNERSPERILDPEELRKREMEEAERDARTCFAYSLPIKADEKILKEFFSKAGKVRDVRLITDRNSRKNKGFAYIEFHDKESVPKALQLAGSQLMGQTVMVQASNAEKNRVQPAASAAGLTGPTRLYVGSLHFNITEEDLRQVFAPFGDIEFINIHRDPESGRSKGFGFIQFYRAEDAKRALAQINGMELAGRQLKVGLVNEAKADSAGSLGELDDDEGSGVPLNAQSRMALMAKLQRNAEPGSPTSAGVAFAPTPVVAVPFPSSPVHSSFSSASACILLKNMFDPARETEPNFDVEIKEDVSDECSKYGQINHISVDKANPGGFVYLKFSNIDGASRALQALNRRWFAGKMITAEYIPQELYHAQFPEAKYK